MPEVFHSPVNLCIRSHRVCGVCFTVFEQLVSFRIEFVVDDIDVLAYLIMCM